jgi:hypothetical protein
LVAEVNIYGIDDTSSAMEAATAMTKKQGMSHPQTIPT